MKTKQTQIETALVFPLLPGKRAMLEAFVEALLGERCAEHDAFHTSVEEERWFVQAAPQGEVVIVYLRGTDPALVFADLAVSNGAFATWFREQAQEITGVDLTLLPPFNLPECILRRTRDKDAAHTKISLG
jgi:hypothetical protein